MAFFDFLRSKQPGGPGRLAYFNAATGEGGAVLDDGRDVFFGRDACKGFVPVTGVRVDAGELLQDRRGRLLARELRLRPAGADPIEPEPAASPAAPPRAPAPVEPENPDLLQALQADPDDEETYLVYGDWLQAHGNPRGELISVQHRRQQQPDDAELARAEALLLHRLADRLLGELAGHEHLLAVEWRLGFIQRARLAAGGEQQPRRRGRELTPEELLERLLEHPSARLLQELRLGLLQQDEEILGGAVDMLASAGQRTTLRRLFLGDFEYPDETEMSWSDLGHLQRLWPLYPNLRELTLQGGRMSLGRLELPELRSFELRTGGLSHESARAVASASWPRLERLVLWTGDGGYGAEADLDDLRPLLEGGAPASLRELGLMNSELADDFCRALASSPLAAQLEALDLSLGTLSDAGAEVLIDQRGRFPRLRRLNLDQCYLGPRTLPELQRLYTEVTVGEQREPDDVDADGTEYRYVSVGE